MASKMQVYASFPRVVLRGGDDDLDASNWHWIHCLDFPINRLHEFSLRPYKWVRYAIGVVVGAEGHLSFDSNSLKILDYNAMPADGESRAVYYHVADEERRRMCPVDPNGARTDVTSTTESSQRSDFHNKVSNRDGGFCVLTGLIGRGCQAQHLLTHSRGDEYIYNVTRSRSRDPGHGDVIDHIDDVRNGLFLSATTHQGIGPDIAFLPTPNFALDTSDVDPTGIALPGEKRCTTHVFDSSALPLLLGRPSGTPLQISDTPDWPPAILFDILYGIVIVHQFGTQEVKAAISSNWDNVFHPHGTLTKPHGDPKGLNPRPLGNISKTNRQAEEREARASHRHPDAGDILLYLPYMFVPPDGLRAYLRELGERAEEVEQMRVQEKVEPWTMQVQTHDS